MAPVLHKVPRHDTESTTDFVLLRADIPALADNLNLQATENENAFFKAFPVATLSKLRAKTFRGSDDEFLRILKGCLLDDYSGGKREEFGEFSMSAAVDGDVLNVSIRKDVNGVKTRVCVLNIPTAADAEEVGIDLFAWAAEATAHRVRLSDEFSTMQSTSSEASEEMETMKKKFKELVEAKKKAEQELLAKFALILNAKKAKIRELTRAIEEGGASTAGGTTVDMEISEDEEPVKATKAKKGKGRKRKEHPVADEDAMDVDEEEDDKMEEDIDPAQLSENRTTDDEIDDRRAEAADLSDSPEPAPKPRGKAATRGKTTATTARGRRAASKAKTVSPEPEAPARHTRAHDKPIKSPTLALRDPEPEASAEASRGFADDLEDTDDEL